MPLNLKDVLAQVRNVGETVNPPSVDEAETLLAQAKAAEVEKKAAEEAARAEFRAAVAEAGRLAAVSAKDAEREARDAVKAAESVSDVLVSPGTRAAARAWLRGADNQLVLLGRDDQAVGILNVALEGVRARLGRVCDYVMAETPLPTDHEAVQRLDAVECGLWRALTARVRVLAGES